MLSSIPFSQLASLAAPALPAAAVGLQRLAQHARRMSSYHVIDHTDERHEPMAPVVGKSAKVCTPEQAVQCIKSNDQVYVQGIAATPTILTNAMVEHGKKNNLSGVDCYSLHTEGPCPYVAPEVDGIFRCKSMFVGSNVRQATSEGRADFIPIFLSETPLMFRNKIVDLDVAIVQVSPPDKHGYCSLGTSIDCTRAALQCAKTVIGQVNRHMPRTYGDGIVHISNLDYAVYLDSPLYAPHAKPVTPVIEKIGAWIADELVEDGATLQMGIGGIPNTVLARLTGHKDLGIHSEMLSDGMLPLIESGSITGRLKKRDTGKVVCTFLLGSQALYDFVDNNPMIDTRDVSYTNNPHVISKMHKMTAINSAIEIDITGQAVSDSIGTTIYSGVGGQVDFLRGAAVCPGGKSILALPSRTSKGKSRIVPAISLGAGVVTTRAHVHYIVTEYGIAYLFGKTLVERAAALIKIAHPDDREMLEEQAMKRGLIRKSFTIPFEQKAAVA